MKKLFIFCCLFCLPLIVWATHNRAGEISYVHAPLPNQDFRYEFTIITYTNTIGSGIADRDSLLVSWGDGSEETLARINGGDIDGNGVANGVLVGNGIRRNEYRAFHTYPGFASYYVISMRDPNRNAGILNINNGASVDVEFYLEDTLFVLNPQFYGYNSSPILSLAPIDFAELGQPFIHNPTAFDPDGDSLVFKLVVPKADQSSPVPNYLFPDEVVPGINNNTSLDPQSGEFVWDSPQAIGEYNIAFLITEYRQGQKIGTMIRDMQILVDDTGNEPPEISPIRDTCILIGEELTLEFEATDPNIPEQLVNLEAFGAPFDLDNNPAIFTAFDTLGSSIGVMNWSTNCEHVFSDAYTVVVKAIDNPTAFTPNIPLTDLETWQIRLIPPAPTGLTAQVLPGEIVLSWDAPYECIDTDKFIGFSVWRSVGCDSLVFNDCSGTLSGSSYVKIADNVKVHTYTDQTALKGVEHSYRVVAIFADANSGQGVPINISESLPSVNTCASLPQDEPIITNVSVLTTDPSNGEIYLAWSKPDPEALDTSINVPPYTYELHRSEDGNNYTPIASFTANSFAAANDTTYVDVGLNTSQIEYFYKIVFLVDNDKEIGETSIASSVFLTTFGSSNRIQLRWDEQVPWINETFCIFRQNNTGTWDSIAMTTEQSYIDDNLINGRTYCYYIQSKGSYFSSGLIDPILNDSQINCGIPTDTIPPCSPRLTVSNDCINEGEGNGTFDSNRLSWESPQSICGDEDVAFYLVYYTDPLEGASILLDTVYNPQTNYEHFTVNSLSACYNVVAVDSFLNASLFSNEVCVESCLEYELPNAFTPGTDGMNDLYTPRPNYRFVSRVIFKVFNRWGNLVYETEDPGINWNGTDIKNDKELPEDVYYYTCKVFEQNFGGSESLQKELSGYIHLFREQ